jgi:hypothetical protein
VTQEGPGSGCPVRHKAVAPSGRPTHRVAVIASLWPRPTDGAGAVERAVHQRRHGEGSPGFLELADRQRGPIAEGVAPGEIAPVPRTEAWPDPRAASAGRQSGRAIARLGRRAGAPKRDAVTLDPRRHAKGPALRAADPPAGVGPPERIPILPAERRCR